MSYRLKFLPSAMKEWRKLDKSLQRQLKKKLAERLEHPRVSSSKLSGFESVYKIKPHASGYRLVYQVNDKEIIVLVIAIGKRERGEVYEKMKRRLS